MSEQRNHTLVHLTGSRRGSTTTLEDDRVRIGTGADADLHFPADREPAVGERHAELVRSEEGWRLEAAASRALFVNGERFAGGAVYPGDVIQIGRDGPLLRLRLQTAAGSEWKSLGEALADCMACARYEADSVTGSVASFLRAMPSELFGTVSPWWRAAVAAVLLIGLGGAVFQVVQGRSLDRRLEATRERLDAVADSLRDERRDAALTPARLDSLEAAVLRASEGPDRDRRQLLAETSVSVMFLLGTYGFEDPASGRPVRIRSEAATVAGDVSGRAAIGPDVEGPLLSRHYTGTAFAVTRDGHFVTNRHLVRPWEQDGSAREVIRSGFRPVLRTVTGFLPGRSEPVELRLVRESDAVDLALMRAPGLTGGTRPLRLAPGDVSVGEEVYVLGYPTGVRALVARSDPGFVASLRRDREEMDLPAVVRRLADAGHIAPLTTRGIVGQVTSAAVVYDAETTRGGSGAPVVGTGGDVVAVNMGIMPEFGGSNLGVPAAEVRRLLQQAGLGDASP